jgi:hypothetical protein
VATFEGLGVYLPDEDIQPVNVKYNTEIQVARIDTGPAIAGQNPVSLSVLLVDSDETPLEGFTISYVAYHDQYGPTAEGSFIQQGQEPMLLNITLVRMGNYSVILTFDGTTHYHGSSAAIGAPVLGTTTIDTVYSEVIERSDESNFTIQVLDETSSNIGLLELDLWIGLFGEHGSLSMDSRSLQTENVYVVDLRGLPTGNYIVRVNVSSSSLRVGCAGVFAFRVEAETSIMIVVAEQSGVVSEEHSLTFVLADSLGDNITGVPVYVSVHDPDGREIYGSPLTVRTALECLADGVTVAWTPLLTGVYTVSFVFEASVHLRPSSLEVEWLIRRSTFLEVEHLQRIVYGESATLTAILIGGISRLQGAPLTILISMNGIGEQEWSTTTGLRGRADFVIEGLLAGNHSALIAFNGTQEFLPSQYEVFLLVEPRFEADIIPLSSPSVGTSCMIEVSLNVIGVDPRWKGTVDIILHDSDITPLQSWSMTIEQSDVIQIEVFFERVGEYTLAVEVSNLPVLELERIVGNLAVSAPLPQIPLDNETVPLLSGIIGIGVAAGVLRRKLNEIVGNFPSDWT